MFCLQIISNTVATSVPSSRAIAVVVLVVLVAVVIVVVLVLVADATGCA